MAAELPYVSPCKCCCPGMKPWIAAAWVNRARCRSKRNCKAVRAARKTHGVPDDAGGRVRGHGSTAPQGEGEGWRPMPMPGGKRGSVSRVSQVKLQVCSSYPDIGYRSRSTFGRFFHTRIFRSYGRSAKRCSVASVFGTMVHGMEAARDVTTSTLYRSQDPFPDRTPSRTACTYHTF